MRHTVTLSSETDWPGFRSEARRLLAQLVAPEDVAWHTPAGAAEDLFAPTAGSEQKRPAAPVPSAQGAMNFVVPPAFLTLCEKVVLHQDPARFALLYRLLWRLVHERALRHDPLDADRTRARHMMQAVRRDLHKMKAFVRFRPLEREGEPPLHVAWFEPDHHIVEAVAPFFVRRFTAMHWAILTPERSVQWTPAQADPTVPTPKAPDAPLPPGELRFGPGASRADAPPADAGEALWLTYYAHIFNPARLKTDMMRKEMPVKYWHNLPEAALIAPLTAQATERSGRMVEAAPTSPARRIVQPVQQAHALDPHHSAALPDDPKAALAALKRATERCRECPIGAHATQSVMGEGPIHAALMVVGEQPGEQEDLVGRPFVGPSGQLFNRAVAELGWSREHFFVTNAVKHFKFELRGKRRIHKTPGQREAAACLHWLESEIAQVRPRAFIALGATAARALVGRPVAVMAERGHWLEGPEGRRVLITLHPSALLRGDPAEREEAWRAWLDDLSQASDIAGLEAAR